MTSDALQLQYTEDAWALDADLDWRRRLAMLQRLAVVVIPRPADWSRAAVRRGPFPSNVAERCWVCWSFEYRLYKHHIVAIQHGGDNHPRNVTKICHACHQQIHPWLPLSTTLEQREGLYDAKDLLRAWLQRMQARSDVA